MLDGGLFEVFGEGTTGLSPDSLKLGLMRAPRWRGQTSRPWSVAAHSLAVRRVLSVMEAAPIVQLAGLVHDVEEAILGDVPTPLKRLLTVEGRSYEDFERRIRARAIRALDLPDEVAEFTESGPVKLADAIVLHAEARVLCHPLMAEWLGPCPTAGVDPVWHEVATDFVAGYGDGAGSTWLGRVRDAAERCG